MKIEVTTARRKWGLDFSCWRRAFAERRVTSHVVAIGPFYHVRRGLGFSSEAAGREFDKLNEPGSGTRALVDLYRQKG